MILCVSRTNLLCTCPISVGKSSHLFYCNCIVYNSFNESFANPVLGLNESGIEFTEVGDVGIWITSLDNCFAECISSLIWNPVVCSEKLYVYSLILHSGFEESNLSNL